VWLSLQSQYSHWSGVTEARAFIGISTDSSNYEYIELFQDIPPNQLPYSAERLSIDISEYAAGAEKVFLRFRWRGFQEYVWKIDEAALWDGDSRPDYDLRFPNTFFARAGSGMTPVTQLHPMRFLGDVINRGKSLQENVRIAIRIINTISDELVYTDTLFLGVLESGDTLENNLFPKEFLPPEKIANYEASYQVLSDNEDNWPIDNSVRFPFRVTANLFSKEMGDDFAFAGPQLGDVQEWSLGNCYYVPEGDGFVATKVQANIGAPPNLSGKKLDFYLYKWEDSNEDGEATPDERGLGEAPDSSGHIVAEATYTIKGNGEESILLDLKNSLDPDLPVLLEDDTYYLLMGQFQSDNPDHFLFYAINPSDYTATWFAHLDSNRPQYGAFYGSGNPFTEEFIQTFDGLPAIRLFIDQVNKVENTRAFPEEDLFRLYPNPARDRVTLDLPFRQKYPNLEVDIINLKGESLKQLALPENQNLLSINLEGISVGNYFMRIRSSSFQSVLPFIKMGSSY
jgi:hypothetical protein